MPTIETCASCGQRNRVPDVVPTGKVVRCGRCKGQLFAPDVDFDAEGDALDAEGEQE